DPLRELAQSAFFHDTGKSFIDWSITNKGGPLNASEFAIMKLHPEFGFTALGETGEVPEYTLYGVRHHHEKLNGKGYPLGLKAPRIDLGIRIITLVDMYDALTTRRVYREAYTGYEALQSIKGLVGEEIDEKVFEGFINLLGETVVPEKPIIDIH
ncbi:MAG: HD-GYP domain-containing protein, partial [bacterium]